MVQKTSLLNRLLSRINVDENDCWIFNGYVGTKTGYGQIGLGRKVVSTHRTTYEHFVGPIPQGLQIDHLCRVRACCNPSHLEAVTQRTNLLRGESPMAQGFRKTHCLRGHPLSGQNLYMQGRHRSCLTCRNAKNRSRYLKA